MYTGSTSHAAVASVIAYCTVWYMTFGSSVHVEILVKTALPELVLGDSLH